MFEFFKIFGFLSFLILIFVLLILFSYYFYVLKFAKNKIFIEKKVFNKKITIVVPTYNEGKVINNKLNNLINLNYPKELMEIIIVDSNSKDDTVKIIKNFKNIHPNIYLKLIEEEERRGKSHSINHAFQLAKKTSDIIFMTDADAILEKDSIDKIVMYFNNPKIGAVTGTEKIINLNESNQTKLEGTYIEYYKKLRIGESNIDSCPIFHGELAGYKEDIIRGLKIRENLNADDSQLAFIVRREGYKAISCPEAFFYSYAPPDRSSLKIQKVRRGQGLSRLFWYNKDILFNKKFGKFGSVIFPANFFMHVISPFLIFSSIVLGFISILLFSLKNLYIMVIIISILSVILMLKNFLIRIKLLKTAWTFIKYQIILLEGMLMFLSGKSLYKWKKVESVRDKFLD